MSLRGRKKGSDGEKTKALLLNIAAKEFADHGYYQTKISTIVKKANVTQPTFYLYFKSKEAIYHELVEMFRKKLTYLTQKSRVQPGVEIESLPTKISHGLSAIFRFLNENPHLTKIAFITLNEPNTIRQQLVEIIHKNLKAEQKTGYFRTDVDMNMFADILVGMIERTTVTHIFTGLKDPDALAKEIVNLLLHGLLPRTN